MNNSISVIGRKIPFIPKLSRDFKPMKHYLCESDTSAKLISRSDFIRVMKQQPCPKGQIYIDFDDGIIYMFPFDPARAEQFKVAYREFAAEYKRIYRERQDPRSECLRKALSLDWFPTDSDSEDSDMQSAWLVSEETPEDVYFTRERLIIHRASFSTLSDSDRAILTGFLEADCNARELARRLGKDPSGVLKLVKRATERLKKEIEKNS